jgi:hypothetical protein
MANPTNLSARIFTGHDAKKNCSGVCFSRAFNISSLNQIKQTIHHNDGLTLYYTPT